MDVVEVCAVLCLWSLLLSVFLRPWFSLFPAQWRAGLLSSPRSEPLSLRQHHTNLPPSSPAREIYWQRAGFHPTASNTSSELWYRKEIYILIHPGHTEQHTTMTEMYTQVGLQPFSNFSILNSSFFAISQIYFFNVKYSADWVIIIPM